MYVTEAPKPLPSIGALFISSVSFGKSAQRDPIADSSALVAREEKRSPASKPPNGLGYGKVIKAPMISVLNAEAAMKNAAVLAANMIFADAPLIRLISHHKSNGLVATKPTQKLREKLKSTIVRLSDSNAKGAIIDLSLSVSVILRLESSGFNEATAKIMARRLKICDCMKMR